MEDAAVFPTDENEDLEKLDLSWGSGHHHNLITPTLPDMITKENWKEVIPLLWKSLYRRRPYFRTHLYAILGRFGTIFPYFQTPMWKKQ